MLRLNNFNLDGNDELNLVSDVRNTYLRSDRGHFLKKKGTCDQKSENFQISVALLNLHTSFKTKKNPKKVVTLGEKSTRS